MHLTQGPEVLLPDGACLWLTEQHHELLGLRHLSAHLCTCPPPAQPPGRTLGHGPGDPPASEQCAAPVGLQGLQATCILVGAV